MSQWVDKQEPDSEITKQQALDYVNMQKSVCDNIRQFNFREVAKPKHNEEDYPKGGNSNSYMKFPTLDQLEVEDEDIQYLPRENATFFIKLKNQVLIDLWIQLASENKDFYYELTKRANTLVEQNETTYAITGITTGFEYDEDIQSALGQYIQSKGVLIQAFDELFNVFYALMRRKKIDELIKERYGQTDPSADQIVVIENEVDKLLAEIAK